MQQTHTQTGPPPVMGGTSAGRSARPGRRCRRCGRCHRNWHAVAKCAWPRALWIAGKPPESGPCWALLAWCHPGATVTLHRTLESAEASKAMIDRYACGGGCMKLHSVVHLGGGA